MFRLEKVFQNDDRVFIYFVNVLKSLFILLSFYFFIILKDYSIYDLANVAIFKNTINYNFFIIFSLIFFIYSTFQKNYTYYKKKLIFFFKEELLIFSISLISIFFIFYVSKQKIIVNSELIIILFLSLINLFFLKFFTNYLYELLISNNIIQKNIMLVGTYREINKILKNKMNKIFVFKCCMITDLDKLNISLIKSEIKFPIFNYDEPLRSILEYHHLGQIWILNGYEENKKKIFFQIMQHSVDIINVKLDKKIYNHQDKNLLGNKYEFELYQKSRFFGLSFLLKMILDKLLGIFFLLLSAPLIILASLAIYIEDGFPILFVQNRTGWDGRRFKIFKLRTLNKKKFDKTTQVTTNDERKLKCGSFIRRFSIDEIPQLFNVLIGDMSMVGPRPHMVEHDIKYSKLFMNYLKRHKCNPGLTGWAQINGLRGPTTDAQMKNRMEHDLWYLNNWNNFLDIYIIIRTFYVIFKYRGE